MQKDNFTPETVLEYLESEGLRIGAAARTGNESAKRIMQLYVLFYKRQEQAVLGLLQAGILEFEKGR